jgi:DNA mismatch repair protein MutS2
MEEAGSMMQDAANEMQETPRHHATPSPQIISTSAHQHIGTSAHQHIGTSRSAFSGYLADLQAKHDGFRLTLDLRGKRVDEALSLLQRYIDDAILLSMGEVRILHGKGNGVLRQLTRDYLRSQKEVKSATDERLEAGGTGITVVSLR